MVQWWEFGLLDVTICQASAGLDKCSSIRDEKLLLVVIQLLVENIVTWRSKKEFLAAWNSETNLRYVAQDICELH